MFEMFEFLKNLCKRIERNDIDDIDNSKTYRQDCVSKRKSYKQVLLRRYYCYFCNSKINNNDNLYFALDNSYCSEDCREYHLV